MNHILTAYIIGCAFTIFIGAMAIAFPSESMRHNSRRDGARAILLSPLWPLLLLLETLRTIFKLIRTADFKNRK